MKEAVIVILIVLAHAVSAVASPETIEMKNRVIFPHWTHMTATGTCGACHEKKIGKLPWFRGRTKGHESCQGCHKEMQQGPLKCSGCHKWGENTR